MGGGQDKIIRLLTRDGSRVGDYFIVGDTIMHFSELAGIKMPMVFVLEDDALSEECIAFLRENGAREFGSYEEFERATGKD